MSTSQTYYAHGKLMLSGEYFALDGANTLAVPTQLGQHMAVHTEAGQGHLVWEALLEDGTTWFQATFSMPVLDVVHTDDREAAIRLQTILKAIQQHKPDLFKADQLVTVQTELEFDRSWGLGSSSTLISLLAQWSGVDALQLAAETFGGSGYDVACAEADGPIVFNKQAGATSVDLNWPFAGQLAFIHLGQKQDTREGIAHFRKYMADLKEATAKCSQLTEAMIAAANIKELMLVMDAHEELVSTALKLEKVKDRYFDDLSGSVKSLGAWGGDFVLVAADQPFEETKRYFEQKGFPTVFSWEQLIFAP